MQRYDGIPEYYNQVLTDEMIAEVKRELFKDATRRLGQRQMDNGYFYALDQEVYGPYFEVLNHQIQKGDLTPAKRVEYYYADEVQG